MRHSDIDNAFIKLGWELRDCDGSSNYGIIRLKDRVVQVVILLDDGSASATGSSLPGLMTLELVVSLSTDEFSQYASIICGEERPFWHLLNRKASTSICKAGFTRHEVKEISKQVVQWAKEQDLEAALAEWRSMPTGMPGDWPMQHLSALSVCGDTDTLKRYQSGFQRGNRQGFAPGVEKAHIDRALELAERPPPEVRPARRLFWRLRR